MKKFLAALAHRSGFRSVVAVIVAAAVVLGLGAVAVAELRAKATPTANVNSRPSTCADVYRLVALRPSEITAANADCLVQSLSFAGELAGSVGQAYPVNADNDSPVSMCAEPKRWNSYPQAMLAMSVGGKPYRLRITPPGSSEHQALIIDSLASVVELASIKDPSSDWNQATGSVTVDANGITGSIDAELLRDAAGAKPVHVKGQWACGAPVPLPAFDSTVPCSNFYALNHLALSDVARMKVSACHPQSLSFTGDIATTLSYAVTDVAVHGDPGPDGDNRCGNAGSDYNASLKFSVGDESFLLVLYQRSSDGNPVGRGSYAAGNGLFSANAFLWLGTADPSHNGLFATDGGLDSGVFWYGSGGGFTVATDLKSGSIDETFSGGPGHGSSSVHIAGNWKCG